LGFKLLSKSPNEQTGKWIKKELIKMGPSYIKIGQIVSSRPDLFPKFITNELRDLQDNIPMTSSIRDIEQLFVQDFDASISDIFSSFDPIPIASASIAQVHVAVLKPHNIKVAVKIQKTGVKDTILYEMSALEDMMNWLTCLKLRSIDDIRLIVAECKQHVTKETDFRHEKRNILLCHEMCTQTTNVTIPKVYSKLTSENIIVLEFVEGIKIDDIDALKTNSIDTVKLAQDVNELFVNMIIEYGFLHCDPHAGNIAVKNDGTIILYDFGMFEEYGHHFKAALNEILVCIVHKDIHSLITLLLKHEIIYTVESTKRCTINDNEYIVIYKILSYVMQYIEHLNPSLLVDELNTDPYIDINNCPFILNSKMMMMFKSMMMLEGLCKGLDSNFNYKNIFQSDFIDSPAYNVMQKMKKDVDTLLHHNDDIYMHRLYNVHMHRLNTEIISSRYESYIIWCVCILFDIMILIHILPN
jgi:predicted unusual protein kinase regulating ubiquinone biosynthesis (AarF/ABC1/UbiB family)